MKATLLLLIATALCLNACAWRRNKSSARIYEGDGPNIKYSKRESAGGPLGGR